MEKFKIANLEVKITEVEGERIEIMGHPAFIFKQTIEDKNGNYDEWNVSELQTGMKMATDLDREKAIAKAKRNLTIQPAAIEMGVAKAKESGIQLPLNK